MGGTEGIHPGTVGVQEGYRRGTLVVVVVVVVVVVYVKVVGISIVYQTCINKIDVISI